MAPIRCWRNSDESPKPVGRWFCEEKPAAKVMSAIGLSVHIQEVPRLLNTALILNGPRSACCTYPRNSRHFHTVVTQN